MGGKGVKVSGDHLATIEEGLSGAKNYTQDKTFLIEEKLIGQEFSLMSFSDGTHLAHMPVVQDHKRAFVGDTGPNTGGMGSYSDSNHSLPFLTDDDTQTAQAINQATIAALRDKFSEGYKGILYGGFMATKDGVKLIEYNARFGDPECMNVIAILESDFVELCQAIMSGNLTEDHASFVPKLQYVNTLCRKDIGCSNKIKKLMWQMCKIRNNYILPRLMSEKMDCTRPDHAQWRSLVLPIPLPKRKK